MEYESIKRMGALSHLPLESVAKKKYLPQPIHMI